ncbi:DUF423 domain-containing protein [Rhodopirellula sp. MGV]|uniref:DUF423 domain-containing protein n=1 Tax=Rhodopirellula sp. MGV TaxID=2023130 RepID=UPI000B9653E6|nr:DUF423 domain-containing protein [Rhodopirellula sp. MGV]OYP35238.1 hypothetical protein CGZ80_12650 [Rhodopirellula sp. MGV]PNY35664.1 DUF423 domain-containing protein [Rhodopirellula baltica]
MNRSVLSTAAIAGALGVIIGAFGAHGLPDLIAGYTDDPDHLQKRLDQFDVGARYHLVHAVAILAMTMLPCGKCTRIAVALFVIGILLFSGSLYVLVLTDTSWLGAITPLGGLAWIAAWISLLFIKPSPINTTTAHDG